MIRLLCFLVLLGSSPALRADAPKITRVVADELGHFDFDPGRRIAVIARYKSQVGTRLEVEGTTLSFALPEGKYFEALGAAKSKRGLMELEVSAGERNFVVHDIRATSDSATIFHELSALLKESSAPRQRALLSWGFREASGRGKAFLEELTARWHESGPSQLEGGRERALAWLRLGATPLGTDPRWIALANQVAQKFAGDPTVIAALEELDLIETDSHWRPRTLFLRELGLVEVGDDVLTLDQAELRQQADAWRAGDRQASLLRGRTTAQYQRHVQAREVIEGMEREEVILAWGYPASVTWFREGKPLFEGWFYEDREVYFVDGWVFQAH